ncbi:MAG TPA: class I SAM-dependent methyltransferase [Gemmatimonadaceae bacterium]|nr:class I SAM-dependent methyltransferase [Gemmatimonadaceae bacterium]
MPNTNREWIYWGERDPLWAVSSGAGRQRGGDREWTAEEFLAEGAAYFAPVRHQWAHYGMGTEHCLEIGAGSGRLTRQLLESFKRVTAIDVSAAQLDNARRLLGADAERVEFAVVDEPMFPVPDASADGLFTAEVFQHFSSFAPIESYLTDGFRAMKSGGTACFQLPVFGVHPVSHTRFALRAARTTLERALRRRKVMDYRFYRASRVLTTLERIGYVDCQLRAFNVGAHEGQHAFFFARKP